MSTSLRVLVVEDSENDALLLKRQLKRGGYDLNFVRVDTLAELETALDSQTWDIVISDYNLPHFNGLTALELLKEKELDLPFIIVSGAIGEEVAVQAMKAGAHDYVLKDNLARLVPAIERELREAEVRRERRRAEAEIQRRNRELTLLNRIIAASVTNSEPEEVLELACRELGRAFDLTQMVAALLNPDKTTATVVAQYLTEGQPLPIGETLEVADAPHFQYLLNHKAPLIMDNTQTHSHLATGTERLRRQGLASVMFLPLIFQDQVVGSLSLGDRKPRAFSNEEISLAWNVADQIASVLARAQLDKERRQLSAAIEQTAESVIITATDSTILYVNPAFEKISGYRRHEVIGRTPNILNSGRQDSGFYQELWSTIPTGKVWQGRFVNKRKDGTFYTEDATITPVRNENGDIANYVSVQRDVTHELQLEEQYRQAQKMEAVGRLAAGIAHDFNNLLTAINGFATLIQSELSAADPLQELVEKILHSGQRAADLVRQLLAFSRKQSVKPQVLNLNTVVNNMDKMLQRIIGEHIVFETILTPELWPVKADPSQLEQVIINLAVNASDAMPDGGQLIIETANVVISSDYAVGHLDTQPGEHVLLRVKDTGTGMSAEVKEHIFEPFFTTKEVGRGTGLGLATVFGIAKNINGHIWVESELGQGTTFNIYVPRVTAPTPISFVSGLAAAIPQGMETILLVEDETLVRELAARVLRQQGYKVLDVEDGPKALQLVQHYGQDIHLLLTDVIMPQMNGKTLAEQLKTVQPELKILFTSGYTNNSITLRGVLEPGVMFIQKPFSPIDLTRKIRQVLDGDK